LLMAFPAFATEKKRVLTTFTILADIARNVAGDKAEVDSITKPGAEIHGYEPTPQDIVKAQRIDLAIANAENAAGGFGVTPAIAEDLFKLLEPQMLEVTTLYNVRGGFETKCTVALHKK